MDLILAKLRRTGATAGGVRTEASKRNLFVRIEHEGIAGEGEAAFPTVRGGGADAVRISRAQGVADGYFVLPYTIGEYLSDWLNTEPVSTDDDAFTQAIAQASLTMVSHASFFTGLYPPRHGLRVAFAGSGNRRARFKHGVESSVTL